MTRIAFKPLFQKFLTIFYGLALCLCLTVFIKILSAQLLLPLMPACLIVGLLVGVFARKITLFQNGINFCAQSLLRLGVILIGLRLSLHDITALGLNGFVFVLGASVLILLCGVLWARILRVDSALAFLTSSATAICGASAAAAISSVLPAHKNNAAHTTSTILAVTLIGTLSMLAAPYLTAALGYSDHHSGIFIGGTIHDVAQVIGAAYTISPQTADSAIIIKLIRVFMLAPIMIACILYFATKSKGNSGKKYAILPPFLLWFLGMVILNTCVEIPANIQEHVKSLNLWLFMIAMTAIGMKTSLKSLLSSGAKPFIIVGAQTLTLAALYVLAISIGIF